MRRFMFVGQAMLIGVFLILAAADLAAQTGTIEGRITHAESGEPLPGVNVGLEGTSLGAVTDNGGRFAIGQVPAGDYTLVASVIGYQTIRQPVTVLVGDTTTVALRFRVEAVQLQEVEIVGRRATSYAADYSFAATRTATPVIDIPQSIAVVTKEVMEDQQIYRIDEAIKNVTGVNQFSGYNDFSMRGFRGRASLINGLRAAFESFTMPITPHLERVEVIKGPASALYADANPGGTINLVTKKPLPVSRQALSFTTGSYDTYRANADFTGPLASDQSLLYRLNLGYENAGSFRDFQFNRTYLVAPSVSFLPSERTRVNVDLVYSRNETRLDRGQPIFDEDPTLTSTPVSFSLSQPSDFFNVTDVYLTASITQEVAAGLSLNASYMKFSSDVSLEEHRTANLFLNDSTMIMGYIRRDEQSTTDNLATYLVGDLATGPAEHQVVAGFDYIRNEYDRSGFNSFPDSAGALQDPAKTFPEPFVLTQPVYTIDHNPETYTRTSSFGFGNPSIYSTYGFYVQDQVEMGRLQVLLNLRRELYTNIVDVEETGGEERVEQSAWLPKIGLVYALTGNVNAYGSYSTGFQPINPEYVRDPARYGGPFDPEQSAQIELGAKGEFFGGGLLATLAGYRIIKRNVLVSANAPGQPELLEQRGEVTSRGIEVGLTGRLAPNLSLTTGYAFNRAEITESDDPEEIGRINENAPRHMGHLWAKYTLAAGPLAGVGVAGGFNFLTERNTFADNLQLPGHLIFDASLFYEISRVRLALNVENLTDEMYWVGGYSFNRLYPGGPRNFLVKVGYTF